MDLAHLLYQQGFVVQFPKNTRSSQGVSNSNLTGPLKSQVFSAFKPVDSEQIGKLSQPAKIKLQPVFCLEQSLPSDLRKGVRPAPVPFPLFFGIKTNLKGGQLKISIVQKHMFLRCTNLADPRSPFLNTNVAQGKGSQ